MILPLASLADSLQHSWTFLQKGGVFMVPLALTAFAGLTAIIYKFLALARNRVVPDALAASLARFPDARAAGKGEPVLREISAGKSSLARLSNVVLRHEGWPPAEIILAAETASRREAAMLHSGMGVLETVITVGPLLGLLGTASGLVTIFGGLGDAANHLAISRGIAEALNTTIFGLAIAVPAVIAHGYFTRRIEVLSVTMESVLADLAQSLGRKNA